MGGRGSGGKNKLPTKVKVIRHTFRKDRASKHEPEPTVLVATPKPPRGLSKAGRRVWNRQAPELVTLGVLTTADVEAFEIACLHYGIAAELLDEVTHVTDLETGKRKRRTSAEYVTELHLEQVNGVDVMKASIFERIAVLDRIRAEHGFSMRIFADFGLTPVARSRLDLGPAEKIEPSAIKRMMNDA